MKNKFIIFLLLFVFIFSCSKKKQIDEQELISFAKKIDSSIAFTNDYVKLEKTDKYVDKIIASLVSLVKTKYTLQRKLAFHFLTNQNYDKAIEFYKSALKIKSDDYNIHYYLAVCYVNKIKLNKKYIKLAKDEYFEALKIKTDDANSYYGLGILYFFFIKDGKTKAIDYMKKAVEIAGQSKAYAVLGRFYFETGQNKKAIKNFQEAINKTTSKEKQKLYKKNIDKILSKSK